MPEYLKVLDKQNKNNRVTAAKHQAMDVSTAPHSPRSTDTLSQSEQNVNTKKFVSSSQR